MNRDCVCPEWCAGGGGPSRGGTGPLGASPGQLRRWFIHMELKLVIGTVLHQPLGHHKQYAHYHFIPLYKYPV